MDARYFNSTREFSGRFYLSSTTPSTEIIDGPTLPVSDTASGPLANALTTSPLYAWPIMVMVANVFTTVKKTTSCNLPVRDFAFTITLLLN
jgi:hypothetical protein